MAARFREGFVAVEGFRKLGVSKPPVNEPSTHAKIRFHLTRSRIMS
jgi:hypothetical protein